MGFRTQTSFQKVSKFHVFIPPLQMYIHLHFFWTETPSGVVKVFEGICATSKRTKPWRCQHSARHIASSTWKVLLIVRSLASHHWLAKYTAMIWCDILYHAYFHDISLRIWHSVDIKGSKEMPLDSLDIPKSQLLPGYLVDQCTSVWRNTISFLTHNPCAPFQEDTAMWTASRKRTFPQVPQAAFSYQGVSKTSAWDYCHGFCPCKLRMM